MDVFKILTTAVSALLAKPLVSVATVAGGKAIFNKVPVITLSITKLGPSEIVNGKVKSGYYNAGVTNTVSLIP